ncbi:MAG: hypothetical protein ACM3UY_04290 [Methanocella sp.]
MSKNIHRRHGENIHRIERIPEKPAVPESENVSASRGGRSPTEIKRIARGSAKQQGKKSKE